MALLLCINAGSSSVKLSLYQCDFNAKPELRVESTISGLTSPPAKLSYESTHGDNNVKGKELPDVKDQESAFIKFLDLLDADEQLKGKEIKFACHRVVHGGSFPKAVVLNKETIHTLEDLTDLAPLHNAPALDLIRTTLEKLPKTTNIAYFDTTFHTGLPRHVYTYPLDPELAKRKQIRKYGFHGISYAFILREAASHLNKSPSETNLISLHLGSGASACAILGGKSVDTSMGLTPLEGLPGATRSGSVDPSLVFHYTSSASTLSRSSTKDLHISKAEDILNKKSGWSSMVGVTDFGAIVSGMHEDETKKLVFDLMVDRIVGYVGNYFVKLGGQVDALTFSGGIGEKSEELRKAVVDKVQCLGFELDEGANGELGDETVTNIGKRVLVVKTDEQFEMARECAHDESFWK